MSKGFWENREEDESSEDIAAGEGVGEYKSDEIAVNCYNHPDRRATAICPKCQIYYCSECMTIRKGKMMCKTCAESEFAVEDNEIKIGEKEPLEAQITPDRPPDFNPYGTETHSEGRYANPIVQLISFILDLALSRVIYFILFIIVSFVWVALQGKFLPYEFTGIVKLYWPAVFSFNKLWIFFIGDIIYFFTLLSLKNRTFGMSWVNLRIVTIYGDFVGLTSCILRSIVLVPTLSITSLFAFLSPKRQALHDWLAQTVVINYSGLKDIDHYETVTIEM
ncbi:RDD family protein [bacterium]|nr:RDD family protein [bacterium]